MSKPSKQDLLRVKRSKTVREWMAPIVKEIRGGFSASPVGYLTRVGGLPRAKVRTASYSRCVPVDFSIGETFGDRQYESVFFDTFIRRHLAVRSYDLEKALSRLGFGTRGAWGLELWAALRSLVEDDSGTRARKLCEQVFEAGRTIWNDAEAVEEVRRENRWRNYFKFKGQIRAGLKNEFSVQELRRAINEVVVEEVMES